MDDNSKALDELCAAFLLLETKQEVTSFLKDLCTPVELIALAERWQICQSLADNWSYRQIQIKQQVSLTTVGRVARALRGEDNQGYQKLLLKLKKRQ